MKEKIEEARTIFDSGFNCCQAVFTPFAIEHGLTRDASLKISSAFGAGMSYHGETCGAVAGAHMVIGLLYGYSNPVDLNSKEKTKELINEFRKKFTSKNDSCICKELLGANPGLEEDLEFLRENGIFKKKCPVYVKDSVEMLNELLEKEAL